MDVFSMFGDGTPLAPPVPIKIEPDGGERRCRRCGGCFPLNKTYFNWATHRVFARVCRGCDKRGLPVAGVPDVAPHSEGAKQCTQCRLWYPRTGEAFYAKSTSRDGLAYHCKNCGRTASAKSKAKVSDRIRRDYHNPKAKLKGYKHSAKSRGIVWQLSHASFMALWQKPCHYCGGGITTIGLDRVDPVQGYTTGNVVPCCPTCNTMKGAMTVEQFLAHLQQLLDHRGGSFTEANPTAVWSMTITRGFHLATDE